MTTLADVYSFNVLLISVDQSTNMQYLIYCVRATWDINACTVMRTFVIPGHIHLITD